MRLLLIGCTGFVGSELVPHLLGLGHELTIVSRRAEPLPDSVLDRATLLQLDPSQQTSWEREDLRSALAAAEGVVNLAGAPIAEERWTPSRRQLLRDSRLVTTGCLVRAMAEQPSPPKVLVNASAVGYYGTSADERFDESSPPGDDFLAHLCQDWEAAANAAPEATRVVVFRFGIVLGADGGALGRMLPVFRAGFGGPIGSGRQWMSWIHRHDLCRLIATALEESSYRGTYNAVAPEPTRMDIFASTLGRVLGRPSLVPVPGPVLKLLLGDGAMVVLEGQQVLPDRLLEKGFSFQYPQLDAALAAATSPAPH